MFYFILLQENADEVSEGSSNGMPENCRDSVAGDKCTFNFIHEQCSYCTNLHLIVQIFIFNCACKVSEYKEDIEFDNDHKKLAIRFFRVAMHRFNQSDPSDGDPWPAFYKYWTGHRLECFFETTLEDILFVL